MIDMYSPTKLPGQAEAFEGRPILTEHYHEIVPAESEDETVEELGVAARLSRKLLQKQATAREDAATGAASAGRGSQLSSLQPGKKT